MYTRMHTHTQTGNSELYMSISPVARSLASQARAKCINEKRLLRALTTERWLVVVFRRKIVLVVARHILSAACAAVRLIVLGKQ